MNERDEFLRSMQSFFAKYMERIETMSETEVVRALRMFKAARENEAETLSFLKSRSLAPPDDPNDPINELRSELSSKARAGTNPFALSDSIENALTQRLEKLRKSEE
jgi:hypothetical protein